MKEKEQPTYINNVEDLFKYYLFGSEKKLYVSNLIDPEIIHVLINYLSEDIIIIYFDHLEFCGEGFTDLKRNGTEKFLLNKNVEIHKQKYYYYSKGSKKYKTTKLDMYINKHCNYTKNIIKLPINSRKNISNIIWKYCRINE